MHQRRRRDMDLKQMGLMPRHLPDGQYGRFPPHSWEVPNLQERKKLRENMQEAAEANIGKHPSAAECGACGMEKSKIKSGKFVKTNIDLIRHEQWPHLNMLRRYTKRTSFDNMDFEAFVAGETRIIGHMEDTAKAAGRLSLLSKLAHWLCRSKDWLLVRGLYESIMESIEMGEVEWTDDFSHYDSMVPMAHIDTHREDHRIKRDKKS